MTDPTHAELIEGIDALLAAAWVSEHYGAFVLLQQTQERLRHDASLQAVKEEAYTDRNLLALAFARLAYEAGYQVGFREDANEQDWPVLYIRLPHVGQVSWHIPKALYRKLPFWPVFDWGWDGHTTDQKRDRLWHFIRIEGIG